MPHARTARRSGWASRQCVAALVVAAALSACWEASKAKETPATSVGAAGTASAGKAGAAAGVAGAATTAGMGGNATAGKAGSGGSAGVATSAGAAGVGGTKGGAAGAAGTAGAAGSAGGPACDDVEVACPKGSFCGYAPCDAPASFDCPRVCNKLVPTCTPTACAATERCSDLTYNGVDMGSCSARSLPDAPCEFGIERSCVDGYYCSAAGSVRRCVKNAALGATCEIAAGSCGPGNYCTGGKGCAVSLAAGDKCGDSRECQTGLFCSEAKVCEAFHALGGACRSSGYSCSNGKCYATSIECEKGLACAPSGPKSGCFSAYECGMGAGISCCVGANNEGTCGGTSFCLGPMGVCAAK